MVANDEEALRAFRLCTQLEGIIPGTFHISCCPLLRPLPPVPQSGSLLVSSPLFDASSLLPALPLTLALTRLFGAALESAHAIHGAIQLAKTLPADQDIVVCLSGRGDKDVEEVFKILPAWAERLDWKI
jgi:tryptophan synthase beta subunit